MKRIKDCLFIFNSWASGILFLALASWVAYLVPPVIGIKEFFELSGPEDLVFRVRMFCFAKMMLYTILIVPSFYFFFNEKGCLWVKINHKGHWLEKNRRRIYLDVGDHVFVGKIIFCGWKIMNVARMILERDHGDKVSEADINEYNKRFDMREEKNKIPPPVGIMD